MCVLLRAVATPMAVAWHCLLGHLLLHLRELAATWELLLAVALAAVTFAYLLARVPLVMTPGAQ
jgi:uncharacterized membrane protein